MYVRTYICINVSRSLQNQNQNLHINIIITYIKFSKISTETIIRSYIRTYVHSQIKIADTHT